MLVEPKRARHVLGRDGSDVVVEIPALRRPFVVVFLCVWLTGWAFGEIAVSGILIGAPIALASGSERLSGQTFVLLPVGAFLLVWLTMWTIGGLTAIYTLLWNLVGRETIRVSRDAIRVTRSLPLFSRTREYHGLEVRELRAQAPSILPRQSGLILPWGRWNGSIAFDYGAETVRCGADLDDAEAKQIVRAVLDEHPRYAGAEARNRLPAGPTRR